MTNDELLSKTISYLRFPLVVGVVFIHNDMSSINIQGQTINYDHCFWLNWMICFFSSALPVVSVPLFYLISGFLFFYYSDFNRSVFTNKIHRRQSTLLIPYLFFNFVGFLIFLVQMLPSLQDFFPLLKNYRVDITTFLSSFWTTNIPKEMAGGLTPIDHPLWFLRDLMIACLATPVIWYLIKRLGWGFIFMVGCFWFFDIGEHWGLPGKDHQPFFFFSLGAYFGIKKINFVQLASSQKWSITAYLTAAILSTFTQSVLCDLFHKLIVMFGIIGLPCLMSLLIKNNRLKIPVTLSNSTFFIYALHALFMSKYMKILVMVIQPQSPVLVACLYFFVPISTILICLGLYLLLKKTTPKFAKVITGER